MDAGLDIVIRPIAVGHWPMVWPLLLGMGQTASDGVELESLG